MLYMLVWAFNTDSWVNMIRAIKTFHMLSKKEKTKVDFYKF